MRQRVIDLVTLLTSTSTLVCCAIPALLVTLGFGAVLAGAVSAVPQIVVLSEHKGFIFTLGAVMLILGGLIQRWQLNQPCPLDITLRDTCLRSRKNSLNLYFLSLGIYLIGAFFAFVAPLLF